MTALFCLDLGTTTGWALRRHDGMIMSGAQSFKPGRFDGGGMRYVKFAAWLDEIFPHVASNSVVYFEEVRRHLGVDAAHAYGGFMATLTGWCERRKIPYAGQPVGSIKLFWTGKGNANKAAMIEEARRRGFKPKDDNEADALALMHMMMPNH